MLIGIRDTFPKRDKKKRVAAYARVSMNSDMLDHSLHNQITDYMKLIQSNPEWEYVGVYADSGISGRSVKKREMFKKLIEDSKAGKIDMILVKSISRFARDTVDTLRVEIMKRRSRAEKFKRFIAALENGERFADEFDEDLWVGLVKEVLVKKNGDLVFQLNDGQEIVG